MAIQELSESELDFTWAQGFLEEWLKDSPSQVKDQLKTLIDGIAHYRQKYIDAQEDYTKLQENYNSLTALSAQYLQLINQQRMQIDDFLIDQQKEFHKD